MGIALHVQKANPSVISLSIHCFWLHSVHGPTQLSGTGVDVLAKSPPQQNEKQSLFLLDDRTDIQNKTSPNNYVGTSHQAVSQDDIFLLKSGNLTTYWHNSIFLARGLFLQIQETLCFLFFFVHAIYSTLYQSQMNRTM